MVDVRDREALQAWLETQPRTVSVVLVGRAALRLLPLIGRLHETQEWPSERIKAEFQGPLLRVCSTIRFMRSKPNPQIMISSYPPQETQSKTADHAYNALTVINLAIDLASADTNNFPFIPSYASGVAHISAQHLPNPSAFASIEGDVIAISDLKFDVSTNYEKEMRVLGSIISRRIWNTISIPTSIAEDWRKLSTEWGHRPPPGATSNNNWWVWTEWYQAILDGTLDDARAKLYGTVPDRLWKQGIEAVNAHIAAKLRAMEIKSLAKQKQSALGDQWTADADSFKLDTAGGKTDARAAKNADVQRRHAELKEKVADLKGDAARLADIDWGGLAKAVDKLDQVLAGPTSDVPARILAIYDYSLSVAHFLEEDYGLQRDVSSTNKRPLPPELQRKLVEIVRQLALWVRSFPTARKQDEELGGYIGQVVASTANAQLLINSASAAALISEEDRQLIIALIDAVRNNGPVSTKAAKKGVATTTNLLFKTGTLLSVFAGGMFTNALANESVLARRAAEWVGSYEKVIVEYIDQQAPDISVAIRSLLDDLRTRAGDPSAPSQGSDALFPSPPPPIRRRDR